MPTSACRAPRPRRSDAAVSSGPRPPRPHALGRGFTLLEMLVVLAVIGLASALVAPRIAGRLDAIDERDQIRGVADQLRQLPRRVRLEGRELWLTSSPPPTSAAAAAASADEPLLQPGTVWLGYGARREAEPAPLPRLDLRATLADGLPAVELPPALRLEPPAGQAVARIGARGSCEPAVLELQRLRDDGRIDAVLARFRYTGLTCELEQSEA